MKFYGFSLVTAIAVAVTFSNIKTAYGDLVFEDDLNTGITKSEETESKVETKKEARVAENAPALHASVSDERKELSKSESMRRQRLREELKNEDLLTQKLEELRLKDEMTRAEQMTSGISAVRKQEAASDVSSAALQEQKVGSAALPVSQPVPAAPVAAQKGDAAVPAGNKVDGSEATSVAKVSVEPESAEFVNRVTITPRGGLSSIMNSMYDVQSRYSFGIGVTVDVTDYIAFTGGYTYSQYSLSAGSSLMYPTGFNVGYLQQLRLNDNVIDAGMRAYFLNTKSKVRPFVGAGLGYRRGYVNYDDRTLDFLKRYYPGSGVDVDISGFSGYIETGLDFKLTKALSITASFKYFNLFSSRQSNPLNPNAFVNPNGYGMNPYAGGLSYSPMGYTSDTRSQAGDALAKNNFYQLMAGVSVSF